VFRKILYTIAFSLSAFSLIKTIPDGGLFGTTTILVLAAFIYGTTSRLGKKYIIGLLIFFAFWIVFLWSFSVLGGGDGLRNYLISATSPSIFIFIIFYIEKSLPLKRLHYLLLILSLVLLSHPFYTSLNEKNDYKNIPAENGFIATYENIPDLKFKKISSINRISIFKINEESTVSEIAKRFRILENIYPIAVPWETCMPSASGDYYSFTLVSPNSLSTDTNEEEKKIISRFEVKNTKQSDKFYTEDVMLTLAPCTPRHLNIIEEFLKTRTKEPFFIYNVTADLW
jgi:hypothetical protein